MTLPFMPNRPEPGRAGPAGPAADNEAFRGELARLDRVADCGYFLALHIRFTSPLMFFHTFDKAWTDYYSEQGYVLRDPMIAWSFTRVGATRWSEGCIPDPFGILEEAGRFGLRYGLTISSGPVASRTVCSLARTDEDFSDEQVSEALSIVSTLHRLTEPDCTITKAQAEALGLIADGLRHAAAADRLGISESALKVRLSAARERLKARTTAEAIQRAKDIALI